ncbi:MAG: 6-phosphogluconolactonase [Leptolyngbyaceae cyanobacterium bins.59]|nr:6-phosphogluconolactonase [Leptolyngbyaceae cyanobacterium bins.59]
MDRNVEVLPNPETLIQRSLSLVLEHLTEAIDQRGQATIALAGGSTPKPLYEALATHSLPWEKIHVFWGDERYVPADHPDSNQGMARLAWLDRVEFPAANLHPILTTASDPEEAARQHEVEVRTFFQNQGNAIPVFDVILLGIGDDGHTASLFPKTQALQVELNATAPQETRLITVGNKDGQPRITFTAPLINQARCVIFIVAGASKQSALSHIFAPVDDATVYPARLIQPQGKLWWLLDSSAGQNLVTSA